MKAFIIAAVAVLLYLIFRNRLSGCVACGQSILPIPSGEAIDGVSTTYSFDGGPSTQPQASGACSAIAQPSPLAIPLTAAGSLEPVAPSPSPTYAQPHYSLWI